MLAIYLSLGSLSFPRVNMGQAWPCQKESSQDAKQQAIWAAKERRLWGLKEDAKGCYNLLLASKSSWLEQPVNVHLLLYDHVASKAECMPAVHEI